MAIQCVTLLLLLPSLVLSRQCLTLTAQHLRGGVGVSDGDIEPGVLVLEKRGIKKWIGKQLVYEISNTPQCSDGLDEADIREIVDRAAGEWNKVPLANVLLVNAATLPDPSTPDFKISFELCSHEDATSSATSQGFTPCNMKFGHAVHGGDVHLNSLMTWSKETEIEDKTGDPIRPNLYSIILHELGHTLGLQAHSSDPADAMYGAFVGDRLHSEISLTQEDMRRFQELYPLSGPSECKDSSIHCGSHKERCGSDKFKGFCSETCGECECDINDPDAYVKCNQDMCAGQLLQYCTKTCKSCPESEDIGPDDITVLSCSSLPGTPQLETDIEFPIMAGVIITVKCGAGYTLSGDSTITCVKGDRYSYTTQPTCEEVISCSSLPGTPQLETDIEFPIMAGVTITVKCGAGYTLSGDSSITCVKGDRYSYTTQPACEKEIIEECKNIHKRCKRLLNRGRKCNNQYMIKNCKKSCELC